MSNRWHYVYAMQNAVQVTGAMTVLQNTSRAATVNIGVALKNVATRRGYICILYCSGQKGLKGKAAPSLRPSSIHELVFSV